jgi:hypothetical protein
MAPEEDYSFQNVSQFATRLAAAGVNVTVGALAF